ncbi:hypothetical protein QUF70_18080, partial [Desulfobacterales bacterium HSG17]|nr:hypothetical protein [Desulfobacterales bacterium HSG17]
EKTLRDAEIGRRHADKLIKVFLSNGSEAWLLIHIEIQNYIDTVFEKRMFVYNYRIFDRYEVEVVSLGVLTDSKADWRPCEYHTEKWGCENIFRFPVVKLLDYGKDWKKLEQDLNPFALVVMAHLKSQSIKDGQERKRWKLHLMRLLFERGYDRQDIIELFRFIDWLLELPEDIEKQFQDELTKITEENKMAYVTSIERLAIIQTSREMILEYISTRFKSVPDDISSIIDTIKTGDTLKSLFRQAITCESIDEFREILKIAK